MQTNIANMLVATPQLAASTQEYQRPVDKSANKAGDSFADTLSSTVNKQSEPEATAKPTEAAKPSGPSDAPKADTPADPEENKGTDEPQAAAPTPQEIANSQLGLILPQVILQAASLPTSTPAQNTAVAVVTSVNTSTIAMPTAAAQNAPVLPATADPTQQPLPEETQQSSTGQAGSQPKPSVQLKSTAASAAQTLMQAKIANDGAQTATPSETAASGTQAATNVAATANPIPAEQTVVVAETVPSAAAQQQAASVAEPKVEAPAAQTIQSATVAAVPVAAETKATTAPGQPKLAEIPAEQVTQAPTAAAAPIQAEKPKADVNPQLQDQTAADKTDQAKPLAAPVTADSSTLPFAGVLDAKAATNTASQPVAQQSAGVANPQDPHDIAGQIVDQAKLIARPDNTEMVIRLKPEHLGELTMKVVVEGGMIKASFHSPNADVRAAIEATLPQLKQDLTNQGLKVDNVGVYTSLDQFFSGQERGSAYQQNTKPVIRTRQMREFAESIDTIAAQPIQQSATGIDYRI